MEIMSLKQRKVLINRQEKYLKMSHEVNIPSVQKEEALSNDFRAAEAWIGIPHIKKKNK